MPARYCFGVPQFLGSGVVDCLFMTLEVNIKAGTDSICVTVLSQMMVTEDD